MEHISPGAPAMAASTKRSGVVVAVIVTVVVNVAAAINPVMKSAVAQSYPERPVRIIVPSTPGSSADILARMLGDGMTVRLGKPFVVINKPGANGALGAADVAHAAPDGYTLMHSAAYSITVQPLIDKDVGYTYQSFTPICQTFKNDQVIIIPPDSPLKRVSNIIDAAKQKREALNVAIPGTTTIPHLALLQLADKANVQFNAVPFKGPAEEIQAIRAGQVDFAVVPLTAAAGSGLAMPGIFAAKRNPSLSDVPTVKEQGYDVAPLSIGGLFGPAGLPKEIARKLDNACAGAIRSFAYQNVVKETLQPLDYFADSSGFAHNLGVDVAEKMRLVPMLKTN
jgi:tripartite-type tricarboxylate transporter receptor subunit TctC